ncbi:MAG: hypothetical protein ABIN94_21680 [Ferruginibacter sp.]
MKHIAVQRRLLPIVFIIAAILFPRSSKCPGNAWIDQHKNNTPVCVAKEPALTHEDDSFSFIKILNWI